MGYFGQGRRKPSFFGDPMFAGLNLSGFDPSGLQRAIDENEAAHSQNKGSFGNSTLGKIIGILGDGALGFAGQPAAYGPWVEEARERQQKMMEEDEKRRRERMERREDFQWQWENEPEDWSIARMAPRYEPNRQAATLPYARARSARAATRNGNFTGGEVGNEFGRSRGLLSRGRW